MDPALRKALDAYERHLAKSGMTGGISAAARMALYAGLAHLGFPVDVADEDIEPSPPSKRKR